jgi:hypothetical protein
MELEQHGNEVKEENIVQFLDLYKTLTNCRFENRKVLREMTEEMVKAEEMAQKSKHEES